MSNKRSYYTTIQSHQYTVIYIRNTCQLHLEYQKKLSHLYWDPFGAKEVIIMYIYGYIFFNQMFFRAQILHVKLTSILAYLSITSLPDVTRKLFFFFGGGVCCLVPR